MSKKILIVEDDPIIAKPYRDKLTGVGFTVIWASDGHKALELVQSEAPDLIILDLQVSGVSGAEAVKFIRMNPATRRAPVLILANSYLNALIQAALKAGATKCLTKMDCTPKQMVEEVQSSLANLPPEPVPDIAPTGPSVEKRGSVPVTPAISAGPVLSALTSASTEAPEMSDAVLQSELQRRFRTQTPKILTDLRARLISFVKNPEDPLATDHLRELHSGLQALTGAAGIAGYRTISNLCGAIEVLAQNLAEKPTNVNPSSIRTVAHALDFLGNLTANGSPSQDINFIAPVVLVVDDEDISRRSICGGLQKANLRSISLPDPVVALEVLKENRFDLILLDINMPVMTGFKLSAELRKYPANKTTPIVFVTALTDFETRTQSNLSGGSDFIAKPFLPMELAVKALTFILKSSPKSR